jgi:hypothetical protein
VCVCLCVCLCVSVCSRSHCGSDPPGAISEPMELGAVLEELANANWWRLARHIRRVMHLRKLWGNLGGVLKRYSALR